MTASRSAVAAVFGLVLASGVSAQSRPQIHFVEPVSLNSNSLAGSAEFDAYGRRFQLRLETNDRLLGKLSPARKAALAGNRLLRGSLQGIAGSWVRLSSASGGVRGLIWDGAELYVVARFDEVASSVIAPQELAPGQTVVFRLSDASNVLPRGFCATGSDAPDANALSQYKALVGEIRASAQSRAVISRQMGVALIADAELHAQESPGTMAAMLAILNEADGIFADQAGLLLNPGEIRIVNSSPNPFTSTDAATLLDQVSDYRLANPAVSSAGIAHLVTGKDLDGDTAGIAALSGVCNTENGVSITSGGTFYSGLVMAHEIGHNLGATHDGEGVCPTTPQTYLMSPTINGSSEFSQCSLDSMRPLIDGAACIAPGIAADVAVELSMSTPTPEYNVPFTVTATVTSQGGAAALDATVAMQPIGHLEVVSATASSGSCASGGSPTCSLGNIPAGESRTVELTLRPYLTSPAATVRSEVDASNDRAPANNEDAVSFAVVNNADMGLTLSSSAATVRTGDTVGYSVRIRSLRTRVVRNVTVGTTTLGMAQVTFTPSQGTCNAFGACNLGDIAPGAEVTVGVQGIAANSGSHSHFWRAESLDDTDGNNNSGTFSLTVEPRRNLALGGSQDNVVISAGDEYVTRFTVTNTRGTDPVAAATVELSGDFRLPIQGVNAPGATCVVVSTSRADCVLGTLVPGASVPIAVTVRAGDAGSSRVSARIAAVDDEVAADNQWDNNISVRHPVDLRVAVPFWTDRVESRAASDNVPVYSASSSPATDFVLTIELPPATRLLTLSMADTACVIVDPQHGRCTAASLPHQIARSLSVNAVGDTPGAHRVRVAIAASSDADTTDNAAEFDMRVMPYRDVGVTAFSLPRYLHVGQSYEFETRLRTAYREVSNVDFSVTFPRDSVITPPASLTGCTTTRSFDGMHDVFNCPIALLPANTDMPLHFRFQPTTVNTGGRIGVQALSTPDVDHANNHAETTTTVVEDADVSLQLTSSSVTGTAGTRVALPRITVRTPRDAHRLKLRVPMPSFANIDSVSAGWLCVGGSVLECEIPALSANAESSIDVVILATSAGTFTSRVDVIVENDANTANNGADLSITMGAAASPTTPATGGSEGGAKSGGGGGSLEWFTLMALWLCLRRPRPGVVAARVMSRRNFL